jgi:hypothetical protein
MKFVATCEECRRISAEYEAATLEWFRVQGQLRVAEYSREEEASSRIVSELSRITARRQRLREEAARHENDKHPRVATARGDAEA